MFERLLFFFHFLLLFQRIIFIDTMNRNRSRLENITFKKHVDFSDLVKVLPTFVRKDSPVIAIEKEKKNTYIRMKMLREEAKRARTKALCEVDCSGRIYAKPISDYKKEFRMRKLNDDNFIVI